jgi:hypothetical protein
MAIKLKSAPAATTSNGAEVGWEDAPTEFTRRVALVYIYGDTGTGRTSLALTMPGPIALAHAGEKIDGVIQRFARQKKVRAVNFGGRFGGSEQDIANQAGPIWNKLRESWFDAIDNWARTAILDTDTEGWELIRLAKFGELNPKGRVDSNYGPVNAEWKSMFKRFRAQDRCSIVTIGQTKDEYREFIKNGNKSSERTGRTIRAGQKDVPYMADVVLRCDKDGGKFTVVVEKGWFNAFIEGMSLENDDCRLPYILSLITETEEMEWAK